ncbi:MAG: hypothetical protein ACTSWL_02385, partial [Promethearchaeota archaeon]
ELEGLEENDKEKILQRDLELEELDSVYVNQREKEKEKEPDSMDDSKEENGNENVEFDKTEIEGDKFDKDEDFED